MTVARSMSFKLAVIYQGLNFDRDPLPGAEGRRRPPDASAGLRRRPGVQDLRQAPGHLVRHLEVLRRRTSSGSPAPCGRSLLVLASEKSPQGYARVARSVDGDAYYWSSVDPAAQPRLPGQARAMSDTVHRSGGRWVAPFAPGFDARLVGGTREVPRRDGATLRAGVRRGGRLLTRRPGPDLAGTSSARTPTSSPASKYGDRYLSVLSGLLDAAAAVPVVAAGRRTPATAAGPGAGGGLTGLLALGGFAFLLRSSPGSATPAGTDRGSALPRRAVRPGEAAAAAPRDDAHRGARRHRAWAWSPAWSSPVPPSTRCAGQPGGSGPPYPVLPRGAAGQADPAAWSSPRRATSPAPPTRTRLERGAHPARLLPDGADGGAADSRCPRTPCSPSGTTSTRRHPRALPGRLRQDLGRVPDHHLPRARQPRVRHTGRRRATSTTSAPAPATPARATTATTSAPGTSSR